MPSIFRLPSVLLIYLTLLVGTGASAQQHSGLDDITLENVTDLKLAFKFHTGDLNQNFRGKGHTLQATPVYWQGKLFVSTSSNVVIAVDAGSGEEIWRFDTKLDREKFYSESASRGVALWHGDDPVCPDKVLIGTLSSQLFALNASTGKRCKNFADNGVIDLSEGINNFRDGEYSVTSPVAVAHDRFVVGSAIGDNGAVELENGIVRAYDARNGKLLWYWDPIPRSLDDPAADSWAGESARLTGAANAWAPIAIDQENGLVFVPTSSPSPDFYGGERKGANHHANSLVALDLNTGALVWAKQLIHHDLWDYDLPAKPGLMNLSRDGKEIPAVVQVNKTGMVFVFNRLTGEPLFPIKERSVPASDVHGEVAHPTQPFSSISLMDTGPLTDDDAFGLYYFDRKACQKIIREYRNEGIFTPPSERGTILYPSYAGGMNWGGIALDPKRQIGIVNFNQIAALVKLLPRRVFDRVVANNEMPGWQLTAQRGTPYGMARKIFLSEAGLPCTRPPWGSIAAIDFSTGKILWQKPFGTIEDLAPALVPNFEWGVPNTGGPLTTAGGLTFIGAASDYYFRAYATETGDLLWQHRLPTAANATPMSYQHDGKQYVAVAVGGHSGLGSPTHDAFMVFSL